MAGRKIGAHTGRYLRHFFHPVLEFIREHNDDVTLKDMIPLLSEVISRLQQATSYIAVNGMSKPNEVGAAATDYLRLFARTALAYLYARATLISQKKLASNSENEFYKSKIDTAKFYYAKLLPQTGALLSAILVGSQLLMNMIEDGFGPF